MQDGVIACILILSFVSPCLCLKKWNFGLEANESTYHNVINYEAKGDAKSDNSQELLSAWKKACGAQGKQSVVIPKEKVFMVKNLQLNGPCKASSIHIQLLGKIVAPSMEQWGSHKNDLITISNVKSLTIDGGGHIEGKGKTWWDKCGRKCPRPRLVQFHACNDLSVSSLHISNSPGAHISINSCENAKFFKMNIIAPANSPNTDAYDISTSKHITFEDSTLAVGDDCIAINTGSSFIYANRIKCGPGHGISIGSLGKNNAHETVEEVHVKDCTFTGTTNGARIKTWEGGSGYVRKVSFENIKVKDTRNPIIINQHYGSKSPNNGAKSLQISDVTFKGFEGSSADENAISLTCSSNGCSNIKLDQINIVSSNSQRKAHASCINAHATVGKVIPNVPCKSK
ncbi:unnamed protein product [Lupinus luteus]|uniref:Polygalacturonase n=1 Tax=Lupinus luteus TaxID=3873 RepID=A0AAV1XRT5_LUPLU